MSKDKIITDKISGIVNRLKSDKKAMLVVLLGVAGVLLIIGSPSSAESDVNNRQNETVYENAEQIENRLESFVEKINGAGECDVMITFESSQETIYAKNGKQISKQESCESTQEYIIIDAGSSEEGLVEYTVYPKIRGVAIVCIGADDPIVKQRIVSSVSALFSLSSNKISVISMMQ